jgi:hypothetical protein
MQQATTLKQAVIAGWQGNHGDRPQAQKPNSISESTNRLLAVEGDGPRAWDAWPTYLTSHAVLVLHWSAARCSRVDRYDPQRSGVQAVVLNAVKKHGDCHSVSSSA